MKQITLRLPDELHAALKDLAEREHRSLHAQVMHMLHTSPDVRTGDPRAGRPASQDIPEGDADSPRH